MPKGNTRKAWLEVATTPHMYLIGLKALMGKVQQEYQQTVKLSQRMPEGRLHLWAMLDYNAPHHIPFPETILGTIKKIDSASIQKFAFAGWKRLLQSAVCISHLHFNLNFYILRSPKN